MFMDRVDITTPVSTLQLIVRLDTTDTDFDARDTTGTGRDTR